MIIIDEIILLMQLTKFVCPFLASSRINLLWYVGKENVVTVTDKQVKVYLASTPCLTPGPLTWIGPEPQTAKVGKKSQAHCAPRTENWDNCQMIVKSVYASMPEYLDSEVRLLACHAGDELNCTCLLAAQPAAFLSSTQIFCRRCHSFKSKTHKIWNPNEREAWGHIKLKM